MARSLALCLAGAAALQAPAPRPARTALGSTEIGVGPETGGVTWDPAGFGKLASPTTMKWFRASELKHGRVAMLVTLGWAVQSNGGGVIPFPLESGLAPLSTKPLEANAQLWGMASGMGFLQIILTCGVIELVTESTGTLSGTRHAEKKDAIPIIASRPFLSSCVCSSVRSSPDLE